MPNVLLCVLVSDGGHLKGLLAWYPAVFSRLLTVLVQMALLRIQLFLKIVLLENGQHRTSYNNVLSSCGYVLRGCPGRFLSMTSFVCWYFRRNQLTTV